ncbi:MAG: ThuA domain-containing protein [Bacteroidales bacterium]|nr:ThuA domain-containing protein [Bacteroidales bacterium]
MKITRYILLVFIFFAGMNSHVSAQKKIKAMIATGQDGSHWWKGGNDAMKQILENTGLFTVDIIETPDWGGDMKLFNPDFSKYELVIINYGGATWAEETRKNFEKFVADGGGVVAVHSSMVPMEDWPAYNEIIGLGAWNGRNEKWGPYVYWADGKFVYDYSPGWAGHHALQRMSTIEHRNPEHPILKGLNPVWRHFKDEIYSKLRGPAKNMEILATTWDGSEDGGSGRHEPMIWTVKYGKGKAFVTLLGHAGNDPELRYAMECTGFQVTLARGAEWAATGKVTQGIPDDFPTENVYTLRPEFRYIDKGKVVSKN